MGIPKFKVVFHVDNSIYTFRIVGQNVFKLTRSQFICANYKNWQFIIAENKFTSIGPIYYEYGSMVITFDSSNVAVIAYEILKNRLFDEKKLLVIMLPTIEPSMIPPKVLPLLIFVNVKSGGCQVKSCWEIFEMERLTKKKCLWYLIVRNF